MPGVEPYKLSSERKGLKSSFFSCTSASVSPLSLSLCVSLYLLLCCDLTPHLLPRSLSLLLNLSLSIYSSPPLSSPLQSVNSLGFDSGRLLHSQTDSLSSNSSLSSSSQLSPYFIIPLFLSFSSLLLLYSRSLYPLLFVPSVGMNVCELCVFVHSRTGLPTLPPPLSLSPFLQSI